MRVWSNRGTDDGSIHAIGNGSMLIYEQGPNIVHVFAPFYSAPSFLAMLLDSPGEETQAVSEREKGTAIWQHNLYRQGESIGFLLDYILSDRGMFFREACLSRAVCLKIHPCSGAGTHMIENYFHCFNGSSTSIFFTIQKGTTFFATQEPLPQEINLILTATGGVHAEVMEDGCILLQLKPGKSRILLSCSRSYPETVEQTEKVLRETDRQWIEDSRAYWKRFTSRRKDFAAQVPLEHPLRDKILYAIDSVSVLVKCQQSDSGGVAAGHYYNLAYVRDQAGVIRGLLALGYIIEARAILDFWLTKWRLFGNLYNAEGMGNDSARLFFTNDEVEIPAYIILSCFQYYRHTQDDDFMKLAFPMLEWAFRVQLGHLVGGMTEFSGDETYIAGGSFPKFNLYQGSAESTLLFITSGEKLLEWAESNRMWSSETLEEYKKPVLNARKLYKSNFYREGRLYANNPVREAAAGRPRFRFSFCEGHEVVKKSFRLTWTERNAQGYYMCPECRDLVIPEPQNRDKLYVLNSVSLIPKYIGSDLFPDEELGGILRPGIVLFERQGVVPSNLEGIRSLGYDYGLMLYNMVKLNHPLKEKMLEKILALLDPTGAWVEYYDGDTPANCRARPWESGMNIESVIEYIRGLSLDGAQRG